MALLFFLSFPSSERILAVEILDKVPADLFDHSVVMRLSTTEDGDFSGYAYCCLVYEPPRFSVGELTY